MVCELYWPVDSEAVKLNPPVEIENSCLTLLSMTFEKSDPVPENAPAHTVVTNITVVVPPLHSLIGDPAIVNANPLVHPFVITSADTNRWQLITRASPKLDFETVSLYTLPILVRDNKGSSASQTIFVRIADVNEPPVFTGALAQPGQAVEIYVAENILRNTGIFTVTVKDPEEAPLKVTVDIEEENDEAPECKPSTYKTTILDSVVPGTNVNSFVLNCHDRDSVPTAMRFQIVSGNENTHFGFDPSRGSSSPKLIVKTPFDFEGGVDVQHQYHLVVHIIDDNVHDATVSKPRTGTVLIDISVQKKGLTVVYKSVNTFSSDDWYIPFIFALMAIMSVGLVTCWCYLIWRCAHCDKTCFKKQAKTSKAINRIKTYKPGTQKETVEVTMETTSIETVFDGEAKDPA
ncbi:hypothetical protein lerEdw1_015609 [Lerista edwardsae]|nr:hypothetical protein lerEdw1_015609 [Lerista edwardsae]